MNRNRTFLIIDAYKYLVEGIAESLPQVNTSWIGVGNQRGMSAKLYTQTPLQAGMASGTASARAPADVVAKLFGQFGGHGSIRVRQRH
jgi:hypothetical protein